MNFWKKIFATMIDIYLKIWISQKFFQKNLNLKCPLRFIVKKLRFLQFKANLCSKNVTKTLNIDLSIILKNSDSKKFEFKITVKDLLWKNLFFCVFKQIFAVKI